MRERALSPIIFLNGPSSSGKTTLGRALHRKLGAPFLYFSSDQLVGAGVLPDSGPEGRPLDWGSLRPRFFDGFHRCIAALADAGNSLIVEHVLEHESWFLDCVGILAAHDVFFVGVHCPLGELERRERLRGDRKIGEGRSHLEEGVHRWSAYDCEIDTSLGDAEGNARKLAEAFLARPGNGVFRRKIRQLE